MPSSINSTSSSPGGLITTGATDNELVIQTGDTTAVSIDASQNVTVAGDLTVNGTIVGGGDVVGPASSTDNAVARFDSTTGKIIQNSAMTIADDGTAIIQSTTAATNTVTDTLRIESQSSGTPAAGIGVGLEFAAETATDNTEIGAIIEAITTDVTATSEAFDLSFKTMAAGAAAAERMRVTSTGLFQFNSGYGSVTTAYGCRAWVNFNGTGTVAIQASGNVTSITDHGTGAYTVNFTNAMPDANYATVGTSRQASTTGGILSIATAAAPTTTTVRILTAGTAGGSIAIADSSITCVSIFR